MNSSSVHYVAHHTVAGTLIFFSLYLLGMVVFFLIGIYIIRNTKRAADFFNGMASRMVSKATADRVYAPRNLLPAAWAFVVLTPLGAANAIYQVVRTLVTGLPG